MPQAARPVIREKDITGLKFFDQLAPLLERLHDDACQRDAADNRTLHFDQYAMLILLYLFIACMLIALWTGRQPTKRTYEMICFYFCGLADEDELLDHIAKLKQQTA